MADTTPGSRGSSRSMAESNSFELLRGVVLRGDAISFQIQIGAMPTDHQSGVVARSIDDRDVPHADLVGNCGVVTCRSHRRYLPNN